MGASSGGGDTTTTQKVSMPSWYTNLLEQGGKDKSTLWGPVDQAKQASTAITGATNAFGLTPAQQQATDLTTALAQGNATGNLGTSSTAYLQNLLNAGGLTSGQSTLANQLLGSSAASNPTYATLSGIADGSQIGQNPYTQALVNQANSDTVRAYNQTTVPTLDNGFLGSGRGGSGLYASQRNTADQTLASQLGTNATNIYSQAYNTDRANQMNALGQLNSVYQSGIANQLSGAGLQQQGITNVGTGIGLGGAASQLSYSDLAQLYNTGSLQTGNAYTNSNALTNALRNAAAQSGTTINAGGAGAQGAGILGGAATGAALGTAISPGYGTAIGAVAGGVAGGVGII